jgi:flagellar biosynthesis/type III secretory pathway protein FliH
MSKQSLMTAQEKEAYRIGYERGRQEGLKKASLLIQLLASDSSEFKENILQNSKEAVEMVRILTGKGE